ncbi:MAG: glycosyl transferase [Planctomycetia bacterium]
MDLATASLLACALGLCAGLPLVGWSARRAARWGLVDLPAAHKVHAAPLPRSGGVGLALALALAWLGTGTLSGALPHPALAFPALGFFLLGLCDDRWQLGARTKLAVQLALAVLAVALGLRWQGAGLGPWPALGFGALTPLMSVLWVVAVVTVVNFLDGIDLITAATLCVLLGAASGAGAAGGLLPAAALGALLAFAGWNVTPARVMVGDAGTHLLGFVAASCAMQVPGTQVSGLPWPLAGALLLPGVVDVGAGLVTKLRRGMPLGNAHRDHPYQRLLRMGWPAPRVALRYGALCLLALASAALLPVPVALALGVVVLGLHLAQAARAPRAPASFFMGGLPARGDD